MSPLMVAASSRNEEAEEKATHGGKEQIRTSQGRSREERREVDGAWMGVGKVHHYGRVNASREQLYLSPPCARPPTAAQPPNKRGKKGRKGSEPQASERPLRQLQEGYFSIKLN